MINLNGTLTENNQPQLPFNNRAVSYGDAIFETLKIANGVVLFWEDHYFRLMSSMRILRMEIPMKFTMEHLEKEIFRTMDANPFRSRNARVKLFVNRVEGGLYSPTSNDVEYIIQLIELPTPNYIVKDVHYKVDLYKDHFVAPGLLSTLKSNNRILNIVGSIYSEENDLDNCLLLNTNKAVIEALNGNLFLVNGNTIKTPPLEDGCIKGILRKQIIDLVRSHPNLELIEASVSSFELQRADELFITNVILGIQPITQYRKKRFETTISTDLLKRLNEKIS